MADNSAPWKESLYKGLPALIVAVLAIAVALYGKYGVGGRMPAYYQDQFQVASNQYSDLPDIDSTDAIHSLLGLGGTLDICYSRLEIAGVTTDDWQRLTFYETHIERLRNALDATEPESEMATDIQSAISQFDEKYNKLIGRLQQPESDYFKEANLKLAQQALKSGRVGAEGNQLIKQLTQLEQADPDPIVSRVAAELRFEQAWGKARSLGALPPSQADLTRILNQLQVSMNARAGESSDPTASSTEQAIAPPTDDRAVILNLTLLAFDDPEAAISEAKQLRQKINDDRTLGERLEATLFAMMIEGDWQAITRLLAEKFSVADQQEQLELRQFATQSITRVMYSSIPRENAAWISGAADGLKLAFELWPSDQGLEVLLWDLAINHSERESNLADDLIEAVLISDSKQRYLVLSLSNAIRGSLEPAENYFRFATESDPQVYNRLASISVWQSTLENNSPSIASLADLVERLIEQKQDPALLIGLAHLRIAQQQLAAAKERIEQAKQALGEEAPAVLAAERRLRASVSGPAT